MQTAQTIYEKIGSMETAKDVSDSSQEVFLHFQEG
jgi:hypothetical protein